MKNVKVLRGQLGMTQQELADKLGVTRVYVTMLEAETYGGVSEDLLNKMCEIFKVKKHELLGIHNLKYVPETTEELETFFETVRREYQNGKQN